MESKQRITQQSKTRHSASPGALRFAAALALLMAMGLFTSQAQAVGVPAGTPISNTATASYDVGVTTLSATSGPVSFNVDEIIDVEVLQQNSPVNVDPSDTNRVLTFLVTNIGNGSEVFDLTVDSAFGGDFNPAFVSVYFDTNGSLVYDAGDTVSSGSTPVLDANGADSVRVFVLHDIPDAATVSDGDVADIELLAESQTLTGPPGTSLGGAGDSGTTAVVGAYGGDDNDQGQYLVASVDVDLAKSYAVVSDPFGGTLAVPGATIRYTITVTVTGGGTADNLVVTDPIPTNTAYVGGTLTLGGGPLSDTPGNDAGQYDGLVGPNGEVSVDLGSVAGGSPVQTITFDALIDPS